MFTASRRAVSACSNFLFASLGMTAAISVRSCPPDRVFEHEDWTRLGRHWQSLNPVMSACIVLRVEWLPKLCSFQLASGTAVARPCSQAGIVDRYSKGRNMKVVCVENGGVDSMAQGLGQNILIINGMADRET
eukprot:1141928-Pelagomonas_calceolata.AAC.2